MWISLPGEKNGSKSLNQHLGKTWKAFLWTLLSLEAPWVSQPWFWSWFRTSAEGTSNRLKRGVSGRDPPEGKCGKASTDNCSCRRDVCLFWVANKLDQSSHRWKRWISLVVTQVSAKGPVMSASQDQSRMLIADYSRTIFSTQWRECWWQHKTSKLSLPKGNKSQAGREAKHRQWRHLHLQQLTGQMLSNELLLLL